MDFIVQFQMHNIVYLPFFEMPQSYLVKMMILCILNYIIYMSCLTHTTISIQQLNVYLTVRMEVSAQNLVFVIAHQAGMETNVK